MAEFDQRKDWAMGMMFGLAIGDAMGAPIEFEEGREPNDYITKYMTGGAHSVSKGEFTDDTSQYHRHGTSLSSSQLFQSDQRLPRW